MRQKQKDHDTCKHGRLLQCSPYGAARKHRVCSLLNGFMLKHWRCVGKDSAECPGYVLRETEGGDHE